MKSSINIMKYLWLTDSRAEFPCCEHLRLVSLILVVGDNEYSGYEINRALQRSGAHPLGFEPSRGITETDIEGFAHSKENPQKLRRHSNHLRRNITCWRFMSIISLEERRESIVTDGEIDALTTLVIELLKPGAVAWDSFSIRNRWSRRQRIFFQ